MEALVPLFIFIVGVAIGTSLKLIVQLAISITLLYWSRSVGELGGAIIELFVYILIGGMLLGDVSWYIQSNGLSLDSIGNPFIVKG